MMVSEIFSLGGDCDYGGGYHGKRHYSGYKKHHGGYHRKHHGGYGHYKHYKHRRGGLLGIRISL